MRALLTVALTALLSAGLCGTAFAGVEPSPFINYQGVLRDSGDNPLEGGRDMRFRFFDAVSGGNECLVDEHTAGGTGDVEVVGGMFNARLGGGLVYDGGGPGTYVTLAEVFRDHGGVYLEVEVYDAGGGGWEALSPRIQVLSAPSSLNSDHLDGNDSSYFLDTSSTDQWKYGRLFLSAPVGYGIQSSGPTGGGYLYDSDDSGYAYIGSGHYGLKSYGEFVGGYFHDLNHSGRAWVGYEDVGIEAHGDLAGGYFQDSNGTSEAYVAYGLYGIMATGTQRGAYFYDSDSSGYAYVANGHIGINAYGDTAGGYFEEPGPLSMTYVAKDGIGVQAYGNSKGGEFHDRNNSGEAHLAYGETGIRAYGDTYGGYFDDTNSTSYAYLAYGVYGIDATGETAGGRFNDSNSTAYAIVANGGYGIQSQADTGGAYFNDVNQSGRAYVGYGDRGIWGKGNFAGGTFSHPDNVTFWADVSTSTQKIIGTGAVSFVQNHPLETGRVIVYAAPEGDEVATYTRGSARLVDGEVRVRLGETFRWVTNPDIGLTAHLTPRGQGAVLYVVSLDTETMLVRGTGDSPSDAEFDYLVYGLRLGFEEIAVLRPKTYEAFLPTAEAIGETYGEQPELRSRNALERFKSMRAAGGGSAAVDLSQTGELVAALEDQRAQAMARIAGAGGVGDGLIVPPAEEGEVVPETASSHETEPRHPNETASSVGGSSAGSTTSIASAASDAAFPFAILPVTGTVGAGDVLALDAQRPGAVRLAASEMDRAVAGCALDPGENAVLPRGQAAVGVSGVVLCRADASFGAIHAGDLLTTSGNPGHAMVAGEYAQGAVLGKAVEALEEGTGAIKVLVILR